MDVATRSKIRKPFITLITPLAVASQEAFNNLHYGCTSSGLCVGEKGGLSIIHGPGGWSQRPRRGSVLAGHRLGPMIPWESGGMWLVSQAAPPGSTPTGWASLGVTWK